MKTQIIRTVLLVATLLLITVNNNAGKLDVSRITSTNTTIAVNSPVHTIIIILNEKTEQDEPDIHYHIFDIDKDDRISEIRKTKARKFLIGLYDILFLTGLHYALYILPWAATHLHTIN